MAGEKKKSKAENSMAIEKRGSSAIENSIPVPDTVAEIVQSMPPEAQNSIKSFFGMVSQVGVHRNNPIVEKITSKHVDKLIDNMQKDSEHEYEDKKSARKYQVFYTILGAVIIALGIYYLLPRDKDLLLILLTIIASFAGGYGVGLAKRKAGD